MASWVKRRTRRAFGVVAVKVSVGSTEGLSIVTEAGGYRVEVKEKGKTLVELCSE